MKFAGLDIAEMSPAAAEAAGRRCCGRMPTAQRRARASWRRASREGARRRSGSPQDLRGATRGAARSRPRLSVARTQHADAVARRAAAAAAGDAGALESVRRRLRARRAVGRPASGRHRGAARGARSAEGGGQLAVRRRARARRDSARRLDRRRRAGRRASTAARCFTAGRPTGLRSVEASQTRASSVRRAAAAATRAPREPKGWLRAERRHAQQPATSSTSRFRSAC